MCMDGGEPELAPFGYLMDFFLVLFRSILLTSTWARAVLAEGLP